MIRAVLAATSLAALFATAAAAQPAPSPQSPSAAIAGATAPPAPGGRFAARQFERMDVNHDGKVTPDEFRAFQGRRFEAMDANRDGKVTKAEFDAAFARMQELRAGRLTRAKSAQPNEDEQGGGPADGSAMFARLDRNGDGVITRDEYDQMLKHRFERLDVNRDGVLTPDEMRGGGRMRGPGA